jgi:hypothetical protein
MEQENIKMENKLLRQIESYKLKFVIGRGNGRMTFEIANIYYDLCELFPNKLEYKHLLTINYFELEETTARQFAEELISINKDSKYANDILGIICEKENKYNDAEKYFKMALYEDPKFYLARFHLIELYDNFIRNDIELEENANYMLDNRYLDRNNLSKTKQKVIFYEWYHYIVNCLIKSLARKNKYNEAIKYEEEYIQYYNMVRNNPDPIESINEYQNIYKFCFLLKDSKKLELFREKYKEKYKNNIMDFEEHFMDIENSINEIV